MNPTLLESVRRAEAAARITAEDVLAMRAAVYGAPQVTQDEVAALIALDREVSERAGEWGAFLGDALVDLVVRQAQPEDYVDDANAAWLMSACGGGLSKDGCVEALVRVLEAAASAPARLEAFVLAKVKQAVIAGGRIGASDVTLLRRLVFAGASEGNVGVTRAEADALFDVDHACGAFADPAWTTFFAQAIDDALTAVSPFRVESRDAAARDEGWLASRPGLAGFLRSMVARPDIRETVEDVLDPSAGEGREWTAEAARMDAEEAAAAPVTDEESAWLMRRFSEAPLSAAGRALISRLKGEAVAGGDKLKPLFDAA